MKRKTPAGQPWVWLTRDLVKSDAWRGMSNRARKIIDFLLIEDMSKGGQHNGKLKAPHRQLAAAGISSYHVKDAIDECDQRGLIDVQRGGLRVATTYALTWFPLHDGTPASDRWRTYKAPENQKSASRSKGRAASRSKGRCTESASRSKGRLAQNPASKTNGASKISSYQGGTITSDLSVEGDRPPLSVVTGGRA